jgi:hypothetical protein
MINNAKHIPHVYVESDLFADESLVEWRRRRRVAKPKRFWR